MIIFPRKGRRAGLGIALGVIAALVVACSTDEAGSEADRSSVTPPAPTSAFATLVAETSVSHLDDNPRISYGHTARIQELAATDERWRLVSHKGAGVFNQVYFPDELQESLGVDLMAADRMYTVDSAPGSMTRR